MIDNNPGLLTIQHRPANSNGKHPGGRPAILLTPDQLTIIATLAAKGVAAYIIADSLGLDRQSSAEDNQFVSTYKKYYAQAGIRVAHKQFELLEGDNPFVASTQAIWLGKQHLGQSDKVMEHQVVEQHQSITFVLPGGARITPGELANKVVNGEVKELPAPDDK